jgi:hypothetical protein
MEYPLPIDREIVHKLAYLPVKLSELARKDPEAALQLLIAWGEGKKHVTLLWQEVIEALGKEAKSLGD